MSNNELIEEASAFDVIEKLQYHKSKEVYEAVLALLNNNLELTQ
jgi:hypothetical protein